MTDVQTGTQMDLVLPRSSVSTSRTTTPQNAAAIGAAQVTGGDRPLPGLPRIGALRWSTCERQELWDRAVGPVSGSGSARGSDRTLACDSAHDTAQTSSGLSARPSAAPVPVRA